MSTPQPSGPQVYNLGFYAQQPVFDRKGCVWAHSLYFRDGVPQAAAQPLSADAATSNVLAALLGETPAARRIIKFTTQSLAFELPLLLPPDTLVVEVQEDIAGDTETMERLRDLKQRGYALAVSGFSGRSAASALHALADVLWVDALARPSGQWPTLAEAATRHGAQPGLMRIETHAAHDESKSMGFALFQGNFFMQPQTVCTRRLSSNQFSRLKLLQAIERVEPDLKDVAEVIRADVALSHKLFGLLNSAFFGLPCQVQSVKQALALIGWEPLRTWIRLVILTDMTSGEKSRELPRAAALRGRFLELARAAAVTGPDPDALFLLGMFSLLPALLDQPMAAILEAMRLPAPVEAGLLGRDAAATSWLALAQRFEQADWAGVQQSLDALRLPPLSVAQAYAQAQQWTDALFRSVPA
jgi:EAL and modified HD-GYP domain-containing signal transduction protein